MQPNTNTITTTNPMPVSELELRWIKSTREVLERLRTKAAELEARLRDSEADIIARIEAGAPVDGEVRVLTRRRQSVAWFTVCRRELGEAFVEAERHAWPVSFTKDLQIP